VHTTLDSTVYNYKSGGALWLYHLDVVIIKVRVHIMGFIALHAVVKSGLKTQVDARRLKEALCARHAMAASSVRHHIC
jgi:hypothetical protein